MRHILSLIKTNDAEKEQMPFVKDILPALQVRGGLADGRLLQRAASWAFVSSLVLWLGESSGDCAAAQLLGFGTE